MSQKKIESRLAIELDVSEAKANTFFNACIEVLKDEISNLSHGENLVIRNFGTYRVVHQKARGGRNPSTGAPLDVPAKNILKFKPAKQMQEAIASK